MLRSRTVLMAMSANGRGASFDPVRIQKLLFLIDREAAAYVDGPHFEFQPYLYGPFDKAVYEELDALRDDGKVLVRGADSPRSYTLTASGHEDGAAGLAEIPTEARQYMEQAARWVLPGGFCPFASNSFCPGSIGNTLTWRSTASSRSRHPAIRACRDAPAFRHFFPAWQEPLISQVSWDGICSGRIAIGMRGRSIPTGAP